MAPWKIWKICVGGLIFYKMAAICNKEYITKYGNIYAL